MNIVDNPQLHAEVNRLTELLPPAMANVSEVRRLLTACWPVRPHLGLCDLKPRHRELLTTAESLVLQNQWKWGSLVHAIDDANHLLEVYAAHPLGELTEDWFLGKADPTAQLEPDHEAAAALEAALVEANAARQAIHRQMDLLAVMAPPEAWLPAWSADDARAYIATIASFPRRQGWKGSPRPPHWYTVRDWHPDLLLDFLAFAQLIQSRGELLTWRKSIRAYLQVDDFRYWTMGSPVAETSVINRAPLDEQEPPLPLSTLSPDERRRAVEEELWNRRSVGAMAGRTGALDGRLRALL